MMMLYKFFSKNLLAVRHIENNLLNKTFLRKASFHGVVGDDVRKSEYREVNLASREIQNSQPKQENLDLNSFAHINNLEDIQKMFSDAPLEFFSNLTPEMSNVLRQLMSGQIAPEHADLFLKEIKKVVRPRDKNSSSISKNIKLHKPIEEYSKEEFDQLADKAVAAILRMKTKDWHKLGIFDPPNFDNLSLEDFPKIELALDGRGISSQSFKQYYEEELKDKKNLFRSAISFENLKRAKGMKYGYKSPQHKRYVGFTQESLFKQLLNFVSKRMYAQAECLFVSALRVEPSDGEEDLLNYDCYSIILSMYCISNKLSKAYHIRNIICKRGYEPRIETYNAIIYANLQKKKYVKAKYWYDLMLENGIKPDGFTYLLMVALSSAKKQVQDAERYLELLEIYKNTVDPEACAHLLNAYGSTQNYEAGTLLITRMLEKKSALNKFVFKSIKRFLRNVKRQKSTRVNVQEDFSSSYWLLRSAAAECDREEFESRWCAIKDQHARQVRCYNVVIEYYAKRQLFDEALKTYSEITRLGIEPSRETHVLMLRIYEKLEDRCNLEHHYDALCRIGKIRGIEVR